MGAERPSTLTSCSSSCWSTGTSPCPTSLTCRASMARSPSSCSPHPVGCFLRSSRALHASLSSSSLLATWMVWHLVTKAHASHQRWEGRHCPAYRRRRLSVDTDHAVHGHCVH